MLPLGRKLMIAFLLALILLVPISFSLEPVGGSKFRTSIDPPYQNNSGGHHTISARISYLNISIYQQPIQGSGLNTTTRPAEFPEDFFKAPNTSQPYTQGNFSYSRSNLENASLYFTYNGFKIASASGAEICNPAPPTDSKGKTLCTVDYYLNSSGGAQAVENDSSCGTVLIEFTGTVAGKQQDYQEAQRADSLCPQNSKALSVVGITLYDTISLPENIGTCLPFMLIVGLLIASMYYSGKDPLSLFDLTTPRLPKVKQFRVKASAAPQMIQSTRRKYSQLMNRSKKDSANAVSKAYSLGGKGMNERWKAKKEVRKVFRELDDYLKGRGAQPADERDLAKFQQRLNIIFANAKPTDPRKLLAWQKHAGAASSLVSVYNQAFQAMKATGEARDGHGSLWSKYITKPFFDKGLKKSAQFEDSKVGMVLTRIPLAKSIVNVPTKLFDATSQLLASRRGAIATRRSVVGGNIYTLLRRTNTAETAKKFMEAKANPLRLIGKYYQWNWKKFEDQHDMGKRKFQELRNPMEESRMLGIQGANDMYRQMMDQLRKSLPTRDNACAVIYELSMQLGTLQRMTSDPLKRGQMQSLIKDFEKLRNDISALKASGNAGALEARYQALYHQAIAMGRVTCDNSIRLNDCHKCEKDFASLKLDHNTLWARLAAMHEFAEKAGTAKFTGITRDMIDGAGNSFRKFEETIVRGLLMGQFSKTSGQYNAIKYDDIEHARNMLIAANTTNKTSAQLDAELIQQFGAKLGGMKSKADFDKEINKAYGWLIKGMTDQKASWMPTKDMELLRDEINKNVGSLIGDRADNIALGRLNMFGLSQSGEALTRKLQSLGINLTVQDINGLELLFKRGNDAPANSATLASMAGKLGAKDAEQAFNALLVDALRFIQQYSIQTDKGWKIFFESDAGRRFALLTDFNNSKLERDLYNAVKPWTQLEYSAQRVKFGLNRHETPNGPMQYKQDTETLLNVSRAYERMLGFVSWGSRGGTSLGDMTMRMLPLLSAQNRENIRILKAFYENLTNSSSKIYDSDFAGKMGGRAFDAEAYSQLLARGFRFTDMRTKASDGSINGIGYMLYGDRKGVMPLLEYDSRILKAQQYRQDGILEKGKIQDIAPLLARMADSPYDNHAVGVSILMKREDKNGKPMWLYGDPFKDPSVRREYEAAYNDPNARSDISRRLAGLGGGTYNPDAQKLRTVSEADLRKARDSSYSGFFGDLSGAVKAREWLFRGGLRSAGMYFAETMHSGLDQRALNIEKWYIAQFQVRQALDAYSRSLGAYGGDGMTKGTDRLLVFDPKKGIDLTGQLESSKMHSAGTVSDDVYQDRLRRIYGMQTEKTRTNYHREIFSQTASPIAQAEALKYGAKLEMKAIDQQYKAGMITKTEHDSQIAQVRQSRDTFRAELSTAKEDYGDYSKMAVDWSGSHDSQYGSKRNLSTLWLPAQFLDSRYKQGNQQDFYWITEAGAMRDPRSAVGAGWGLDYAFYVGYQTGQITYERSRFYATGAGWEKQQRYPIGISLWAHKLFNDIVSQGMRQSSHYPSYLQMDAIHPGEMGKPHTRPLAPMLFAPLRMQHSSDYFRSAAQALLDFTGASTLSKAYQQTADKSSGDVGFFRGIMDKAFVPSDHYASGGRLLLAQRFLDQAQYADDVLAHNKDARDAYERYKDSEYGSADAQQAARDFVKHVNFADRRPVGVQMAHSGSDMQDDGSRNRFMNLYVGFHENVWRPISPGLHDLDPRTGATVPFTQIASGTDRAEENNRLSNLKHFSTGSFDSTGQLVYNDAFHTHNDAYREVFKRNTTSLLHVMKEQNEYLNYNFFNSPSIMFFNPLYGAAIHFGLRNAIKNMDIGSSMVVQQQDSHIGQRMAAKLANIGSAMKQNFTITNIISKHKARAGEGGESEANAEAYFDTLYYLGH